MMSLTFLNHYAPIWIFIVLAVVFYAGLKATKITNKELVLVLTGIVLSFLVVASKTATNFLLDIAPYILIIALAAFFILIAVFLMGDKDLGTFKRIMAWAGFIIAIAIIIFAAFDNFQALSHMTPDSSDSGLSDGMEEFKDWIYSTKFKEGALFLVAIVIVCALLFKK